VSVTLVNAAANRTPARNQLPLSDPSLLLTTRRSLCNCSERVSQRMVLRSATRYESKKEEEVRLFSKSLSEYFAFQRGLIILISLVGLTRLTLSLADVSDSIVK